MALRFTQSLAEIGKKAEKELLKQVNARLVQIRPNVRRRFKGVLTTALLSSPEIESLRGGDLKGEFGLDTDPSGELVAAIMATLDVKVKTATPKRKGGLSVILQPSDYSNLLSQPWASQAIDGGRIPWLEWLLTLGDSIIISDYGVEFGAFPSSRSGIALMSTQTAPYKVNGQYSGTRENNFITRAIRRIRPELDRIFKGAL
tara:strand:+ start:2041 stop:2646 length:606 start_codon:yes stop_codon:yes gene_type:complete